MTRTDRQPVASDAIDVTEGARVVLVADTHSRPHPGARALIEREAPRAILHAGDIGDLAVLEGLREIAEVFAVRGNIDETDAFAAIPQRRRLDLRADGRVALRVVMLHIAVFGPKLRPEARAFAAREGADLVVCGHSHVPFGARDRGLTVFNPGSIGPRRFQLPIVFGVLTFSSKGIGLRHVDCETGGDWRPPKP